MSQSKRILIIDEFKKFAKKAIPALTIQKIVNVERFGDVEEGTLPMAFIYTGDDEVRDEGGVIGEEAFDWEVDILIWYFNRPDGDDSENILQNIHNTLTKNPTLNGACWDLKRRRSRYYVLASNPDIQGIKITFTISHSFARGEL